MRTHSSAATSACVDSPSPSAPSMSATRSILCGAASSRVRAFSSGVSASRVKPASRTESRPLGQVSSRAYGTENTAPMETLTLRRYSGSAQSGDNSTASMPRAAAERKIAPMLVWSFTDSMTTTRRAERSSSPAVGSGLRCMEARAPRCTW